MANSYGKRSDKSNGQGLFTNGREPDNSSSQGQLAVSKWNDPEYGAGLNELAQERESNKLSLKTVSSITSESTTWTYPDWLAEGELSVLVGVPGSGKTAFACSLAAGVTKGNDFELYPGLAVKGDGHVIIVNDEDNHAKTIKPRLEAAGANMDRVHIIDTRGAFGDEEPFSFAHDRDMDRLVGLNKRFNNNIGLIVIDPIYLAVDGDHGNNYKARKAYHRLSMLAKKLSCAILGIAHSVKNPSGKQPLARIGGTSALREVPRAILLLNKIANSPTVTGGTHVLVHAKNSIGEIDDGFEYCLKQVDIVDQNSDPLAPRSGLKFIVTAKKFGSAEDILNEADRPKQVENAEKTKYAEEFLQAILKDGSKLWIDIEVLAQKDNVKKGTLMLAKSNLKITTHKRDGDGRSVWTLPNSEIDNSRLVPISGDETP